MLLLAAPMDGRVSGYVGTDHVNPGATSGASAGSVEEPLAMCSSQVPTQLGSHHRSIAARALRLLLRASPREIAASTSLKCRRNASASTDLAAASVCA